MPMDFPDMPSLLQCARIWEFREPGPDEAEAQYRAALADFVAPRDMVESQEIRTGKGWNRWDADEAKALVLEALAQADGVSAPADRAECLAWAKRRALKIVDLGRLAVDSMLRDLKQHPDLAQSVRVGELLAATVDPRDPRSIRRFIEGFN